MANPDVGSIICIFTGESSPVREDKKGKLYYVSSAGMIKPNMPAGQKWMRENVKLFVNENDSEEQSSFWGIFE
ncbi:hypothetical protein C0Z01_14190 [Photobacterium kishitanii]|uniref:hypothetical protein n=1 Tax=Photobacterium kishitanii TaxID=318456 RepID=UPI0007EFA37F|nr:hypothetical protein [Photobacterium kishitanii]OBU24960.1 hypothetical protein AYY22_21035 [Photobacterium kishitanii]PSW68706.1 hypothetical protein C0Z01_14190 [Photobacterium kishitanii]